MPVLNPVLWREEWGCYKICRYVVALSSPHPTPTPLQTFLKNPPNLCDTTSIPLFWSSVIISRGQFLSSFAFLTIKKNLKLLDPVLWLLALIFSLPSYSHQYETSPDCHTVTNDFILRCRLLLNFNSARVGRNYILCYYISSLNNIFKHIDFWWNKTLINNKIYKHIGPGNFFDRGGILLGKCPT